MGNFALTRPGLQEDQGIGTDPSTGMPVQLPPIIHFFKNAALRGHQAALDEMMAVQPNTSNVQGQIAEPGQTQTEQISQNATPTAKLPKFFQPSFAQTTTDAQGLPAQINPAETKLGKLVHILAAAGKGAAAGWGTYNAAAGADRAREIPMQMAQGRQQLQSGELSNEMTRAGMQPVQTPYGYMPTAFASKLFPAMVGAQGKVQAAQIGAGAKENVANTQAQTQEKIHRYLPVQGVGLFDTSTRQVIPDTGQGIVITPEIAADHNLPQQFIGKPMTLQNLAAVQRSDVFQNSPMMTAQGPVVINRKTSTATPVKGPGGQTYSPPALASPREVADVNNPGQTVIVPGGQSFGQPGVQSASVQVPKKAAAAEVPTNIGNQRVAFTTMIDHAELLRKAAKALSNGDNRTLAGLKNSVMTEFGVPDVTNFNAIANAYNHEVTTVVAKGHMTDNEVKTGGATMPSNANFATIEKVLNSYKALAQSKMKNLNAQKQAAINQSQPKKNGAASVSAQPSTEQTATGPDGHKIVVRGGRWVDAATGNPIQ